MREKKSNIEKRTGDNICNKRRKTHYVRGHENDWQEGLRKSEKYMVKGESQDKSVPFSLLLILGDGNSHERRYPPECPLEVPSMLGAHASFGLTLFFFATFPYPERR